MDSLFFQYLNANALPLKACRWPSSTLPLFYPFPQSSFKSWSTRILTPASKLKQLRIRSEFDGKANGALSADFDPRFIDRVCFSFVSFFKLFSAIISRSMLSSVEAFDLVGPFLLLFFVIEIK